MGPLTMYALAALLVCLSLTSTAVPTQPSILTKIVNRKAYVYKYSAVVSTGQNDPSPFASKFQIQGKMIVKPYVSDPDLKHAEYVKFHDIKHTVYNGPDDGDVHGEYQALQDMIKDFEEPILVVYDENQKVKGIRVQDKEAIWSKNMKKALASIMQVDFKLLEMHKNKLPTVSHQMEKTIHGDCQVDYSVHSKDLHGEKMHYVRKTYEPRKCSAYVQHIVSDAKRMSCKVQAEEDLVTSVERIYEIKDSNYLINKVISHEKSSYLPWLHRSSGIQYIDTNQTFEFEKAVDESELKLAVVDFKDVPLTNDITFDKRDYTSTQNENHFGRHTIKSSDLLVKIKELLITIVDYLKVNNIVKEVDPKYKNVLQKLHHNMGYLDSESMHYIYKHFNTASEKGNMTRNIFLEMLPHTGTYAAWNFTKDVIANGDLEETTTLNMLANLPMYILNPNEEFAKEMIQFKEFDEDKFSKSIKTAGVLCYSILLHKTYKNVEKTVPLYLQEQLSYFNERIKYEPTYQSKIVYIMAMRNVEVGSIYEYLAPIVRGEDVFFVNVDIDKPEKYRMAAMWAVAKSISHDRQLTYNLFWPILSNNTQPLSLRVTAYELLVPRNPMLDMNLLMNVYWMMSEERDDHMFNYHYTTMKSMAESTDPCMQITSEMMRKILRLTTQRKLFSSTLSRVKVFDYFDTKYGHGKIFKIGTEVDEASGIPHVGYYEIIRTFGRRPKQASGIFWKVDGVNSNTIMSLFNELIRQQTGSRMSSSYEMLDEKVKSLLRQTYGYKLLEKQIRLEYWTMDKGYVTNVKVYLENSLSELLRDYAGKVRNLMDAGEIFNRNLLDISFLNHYKLITVTDIGIPAIFYNENPQLAYMKLKLNTYPLKSMVTTQLEFETKYHHDSFYKMEFYNPFVDITQSVQRRVTTDFALPIDMTVSFNFETRSLKMVLPRMPESRFSIAGVKVYSVDQVEIGKDHTEALKTYCPLCKHLADIATDSMNRTNYEDVLHSVDTGLEYTHSIFDCEKGSTPSIEREEGFRVFNTVRNNVNGDPWPEYLMIINQRLFNSMKAPHTSTCGTILKVSPCTVHPTSHIEMNWRFNFQKLGDNVEWNVRGSIDTKAASTNNTIRFWDVDLKAKTSQFFNDLKLKLTRQTSGENNLKICLEARKEYPNFITNTEAMKHETNTKIFFTMDHSNSDQCSLDDTHIKALIKGELLNEQKEQMEKNIKVGSCFKNPTNPLDLDIAQRFDWNCLYQAVKGTTLRKYSIDVSYQKIPHEILAKLAMLDDYLRLDNLPHITYKPDHTEEGNVKISFTYSVNNNYGNITVINPYYSYELDDILYGSDDEEDRHNDLVLDNTGFSTSFLVDFYKGEIRPCIVHSNDIITDLNQTIPMDFKDWTLMSGDFALMSYAVFVKAVHGNKVAVKIYANMHVLEVQPGQSKPEVILDGTAITNYEKGILLPADETTYFKLMMVNQLLLIETDKYFTVKLYYTPYNVVILPHIVLDRVIDGMCGHMGTKAYIQQVPLVYSRS